VKFGGGNMRGGINKVERMQGRKDIMDKRGLGRKLVKIRHLCFRGPRISDMSCNGPEAIKYAYAKSTG